VAEKILEEKQTALAGRRRRVSSFEKASDIGSVPDDAISSEDPITIEYPGDSEAPSTLRRKAQREKGWGEVRSACGL